MFVYRIMQEVGVTISKLHEIYNRQVHRSKLSYILRLNIIFYYNETLTNGLRLFQNE